MRYIVQALALLSIFLVLSGCEKWVQDVDDPIDVIPDDALNNESQVPFLITGVKARFATTHDQLTLLTDGLSDALFFDANVPNATFPSYKEIDDREIKLDNNSVDGLFFDLGELRFFADDLVRRVNEIEFQDQNLKNEALYVGNFFGGVARFFYAAYFGLEPTRGGGVIDAGPFIPSDQMYQLALEKFEAALSLAPTDYDRRVVHSMIAKIYLLMGDKASALTHAQQGMQPGDEPFNSLHSVESTNAWYFGAGRGRTQWVMDGRFKQYVDEDPKEAARLPMREILGNDGVTVYYGQDKYPDRSSPIPLMTWQENELMLAELELDTDANSALSRVNNVRASHGLDPLASLDFETLLKERDKELFGTGNRVLDQRRFNRWHSSPGPWEYLPITERERNSNPNL